MKEIKINTDPEYTVHLESDFDSLADKVLALGYNKVAVVTDDIVEKLYLDEVKRSFDRRGVHIYAHTVKSGEENKNISTYLEICSFLSESEISRSDIVLALGGGVIGDTVGFAASTYMRGVAFGQIPTTLLAMIDSSVGGKTGINSDYGKNQLGVICQPKIVYCNVSCADTLPDEQIINGIGEVVKYGVLADRELFYLLLGDFKGNLKEIVYRSVKIKNHYVSEDEKDFGIRRFLNLGHTIGHVIEKESGYTVPHGRAVFTGLYLIAKELNGSLGIAGEIIELLEMVADKYAIDYSYPLDMSDIINLIRHDKKRMGDKVSLIAPLGVENCRIIDVPLDFPLDFTRAGIKYDAIVRKGSVLQGVAPEPGSKSVGHRLIILAAFNGGRTEIENIQYSEDIFATLSAVRALGADVICEKNKITVAGFNRANFARIDCNESGSTLRFMLPIAAMLGIESEICGSERLSERGAKDLICALREAGVEIDGERLPVRISGVADSYEYTITGEVSSQYVSGLMLGAYASRRRANIRIEGRLQSAGYAELTAETIRYFGGKAERTDSGYMVDCTGVTPADRTIKCDADYSNMSYWYAAKCLTGGMEIAKIDNIFTQGDSRIVSLAEDSTIKEIDVSDIPDLAPALAVILAGRGGGKLIECARLRIKECDRLDALNVNLNALGVDSRIEGDSLIISGSTPSGGEADGRNDHRIVMSMAILALAADGDVYIKDAYAVAKSYPAFWQHFRSMGGRVDVVNIR